MDNQQIIEAIQEQLNELTVELFPDGSGNWWFWSFRCAESEKLFESPIVALIDFACKQVQAIDEMFGAKPIVSLPDGFPSDPDEEVRILMMISVRIPELRLEKHSGPGWVNWCWEFREIDMDEYFDSLPEAVANFAATTSLFLDEMMEWKPVPKKTELVDLIPKEQEIQALNEFVKKIAPSYWVVWNPDFVLMPDDPPGAYEVRTKAGVHYRRRTAEEIKALCQ